MATTSPSIEARLSALENKLGIQGNGGSGGSGGLRKRTPSSQNFAALTSEGADVMSRLDAIQGVYDSRTNATFRETCTESVKLLRDLDAGSALTYQQHAGSSAPLYYRRQEVLASAGTLKQDMDQILKMVPLLLVGNTNHSGSNNNNATMAVTTLESGGAGAGSQTQASHAGSGGNSGKSKDGSGSGGVGSGGSAAAGSGVGVGTVLREDEVIHAAILNSASISTDEQRRLDVARMDISDLQKRTNIMSQRVDNLLKLYYSVITSVSAKIVLADEEISLHEK